MYVCGYVRTYICICYENVPIPVSSPLLPSPPSLSHLFQYMFSAVRDCAAVMRWSAHEESPKDMLSLLHQQVTAALEEVQ